MAEVASQEPASSAAAPDGKKVLELTLPSQDAKQWAYVKEVLAMPVKHLHDLDVIITKFSALDRDPHVCTFFKTAPGSEAAGKFDWDLFLAKGVPFIVDVALDMPKLFANMRLPIFQMRSSWAQPKVLHKETISLTRRQCACLLAHSFFGSLKRPAAVQPNDFRFTAVDMFNGTAASPNSAVTFLNYFSMLGRHGVPNEVVTFERQGYRKGRSPWQFKDNEKPLCKVAIVDGNIDDCVADLHAELVPIMIIMTTGI